jgi:pilus assembly protein CpaF
MKRTDFDVDRVHPDAPCSPIMDDPNAYLALFFEPVRPFLQDDAVSEILINGPNQVYIELKGKLQATEARFVSEPALKAAAVNVAKNVGRLLNEENPRLDARLPDGSRVHAVIPPLSRCGTVVAIRKFKKEKLAMEQLIAFGSITPAGAQLIDAVVKLHKNVIVSGATSSGKTSVLNVLSGFIPGNERILVIEDASELQLQQAHTVCFETRKPDKNDKGEVTIRDLIHSALRLRPDRLVIGEIRGGEALDLLQALNTGHAGSMSTIHANSSRDCLSRIETCSLLSGIDIPLSALRSQVASAIDVVVHTARLSDGSRKITAVSEVLGLKDGEYVLQDLYRFDVRGIGPDGSLDGVFTGTGQKPTFLHEAALRKLPLDEAMFEAKEGANVER